MGLKSNIIIIDFMFLMSRAASVGVHNVKDYGSTGDGQTDSTKAIQAAWSASCEAGGNAWIVIPEGAYLVGPLMFKGPCKGVVGVQLQGQLLASIDLNAYARNWVDFQYINGLIISGGERFNGQGASAWPHNQCPKKWDCKLLPTSLVFSFVTNATVRDISSIDSKLFHTIIFQSKNITFDSIKISALGDSPNTDGIHIGDSTKINIVNSAIGIGDDCISLGSGSTNVTISNVFCGPGHGISVGSLGKYANEKDVVGLTVSNCTLTGTTNGVRIKTWQSSSSALVATSFVYEDIIMNNVYNPIIIDQDYCPYISYAGNDPSLVKIKNVKFRNIRGTSASPEAIKLVCSDSFHCEGVEVSDIDLKYNGEKKGITLASTCVIVHVNSDGKVNPDSCI